MGDSGYPAWRGRLFRDSARPVLAVLTFAIAALVAACGGGGGSNPSPAPQKKTALVIGSPSGPIYDELASTYHIVPGQGSESSIGFDVLIYDGATVTPEQIGTLPTTVNFLSTGKILIVLAPTQEDREALEGVTGVTALVDAPALTLFDSFTNGLLQAVSMVEFPTTVSEDSIQTIPPGSASAEEDRANSGPPDDATVRSQAAEWIKSYEQKWSDSRQAFRAVAGVSQARLAAAAVDTDGNATSPAAAGSDGMDLSSWLEPAQEIPPAPGSQFLTAQPFFDYQTKTLNLQSIYYQPRFKAFYPLAVQSNKPGVGDVRGACIFAPYNAAFNLPPPPNNPAVSNVEVATYRILQQVNGVYSHEVIARQFVSSVPNVVLSDQPVGTEAVSYCLGGIVPVEPLRNYFACLPDRLGCNAFTETTPLTSLRGFNEQVISNFSWDADTAPRVTLDSWLPKAANNVTTVTSSQTYEKIVQWTIQGALSGQWSEKPNVGVSLGGNYGQQEKWAWTQGTNMSVPDWEMRSPGPSLPGSTYDFSALNSPNNLANIVASASAPASPGRPITFVGPPSGLNALQAQGLVLRNENDWSTKFVGGLLPGKATLNADVTLNYGEVFSLYTLTTDVAGFYPYSALHSFTMKVPIEFDFSKAILQPPLPATWTITADLGSNAVNGFFPIKGTVTLNEQADIDTTLYLGAQLEPSGSSFTPKPSVIKNLPISVVIPAGQTSASFNAYAQRVGSPYNVQWYAFQSQGQQATYGMTIPAH